MAQGRPTDYNAEIASRICELVATTPYGLQKLCDMYDWMPDMSSIYLWKFKHESFSQQYLQAKEAQIDLVMDELDSVLDENLRYYMDDKGNEKIDPPSASIAIAKANNRKWHASKLRPRKYGDSKLLTELEDKTDQNAEDVKNLRAELDAKNKKAY